MSYSMYPGPRLRPFSNGQFALIIVVVALVILGSGILVYTSVTSDIATTNASSTATALANAGHLAFDATNNAVVSSDAATAQVALTALAQANMTATAQASLNATATANARASATANAKATAIAQTHASATAQAYAARDPYPPYTGNLVLSDPLFSNAQGHGWDVYALGGNDNCQFTGSGYESTEQTLAGSYYDISNNCVAEQTNFANFTFQADVTIMKGGCGGISFRGNSKTNSGYTFIVCASSTEIAAAGDWVLRAWSAGNYTGNLAEAFSPAIHKTYGQTNVLAVVAMGTTLTLYANGQQLTTLTSTLYSGGQIGLVSSGVPGTLGVVAFHNAEVWAM